MLCIMDVASGFDQKCLTHSRGSRLESLTFSHPLACFLVISWPIKSLTERWAESTRKEAKFKCPNCKLLVGQTVSLLREKEMMQTTVLASTNLLNEVKNLFISMFPASWVYEIQGTERKKIAWLTTPKISYLRESHSNNQWPNVQQTEYQGKKNTP